MARFARLLATTIANADSGEALKRLADEQAAIPVVTGWWGSPIERPPSAGSLWSRVQKAAARW
jgi:hypothetical protein